MDVNLSPHDRVHTFFFFNTFFFFFLLAAPRGRSFPTLRYMRITTSPSAKSAAGRMVAGIHRGGVGHLDQVAQLCRLLVIGTVLL